ncbi:SEL1-like repeat protein [Actinomadura formosensis]|uniref:hypothetical protein n=1 Tax=Actinomadura formosensis TaxID=60706 RepID=UPI000A9A5413|nr:hypothetical protein [Actinomadura formosensis]
MADKALSQHAHDLPHGPLIESLNKFRDFCGRPSLGDIERVSMQLAKRYGGRYGKMTLSQPTVSAVLAGKRKKPPKRTWLVAFVLACEWYAWTEAGVPTEWGAPEEKRTGPPDPDRVLAPWIEEHQAALAAYRSRSSTSGSPAGPAGLDRSARPPAQVQWPTARPDSPAHPLQEAPMEIVRGSQRPRHPDGTLHPDGAHAAAETAADHDSPVPDRLGRACGSPPRPSYESFRGRTGTPAMREPLKVPPSAPEPVRAQRARPAPAAGAAVPAQPVLDASQTRIRQEFGVLGLQLYDRAQEGHVEAAFRLGTLLCANQSLAEGMFYLDKARNHRHTGAAALGRALDRGRLRQRALETVYGFARDAHTDNALLTAVSYCAIATRNDHADSAHMLATLLIGMGQGELADLYQRHAARLRQLAAREHDSLMTDTRNRSEVASESSRLLASIAPEPRFDQASATQPIDMAALFATTDAEELAEAVQRIPLASTTSS